MPVTKVSAELLDLLNQAIAREIQVTIQYMWQHVMWSGVKAFAVKDELKSVAIEEMKHAEGIAERLFYLGETPTTKPTPIFVGGSLKEQIEADMKAEEEAIVMYKKVIALAMKEGDEATAHLFREILTDEEDHHDTFESILEEV